MEKEGVYNDEDNRESGHEKVYFEKVKVSIGYMHEVSVTFIWVLGICM